MTAEVTLSHSAARAVYDRIGRWQDTQRFYEDFATADLLAHADLSRARSVLEFGSGTGRFAERLLREHLPPTARYRGVDVSPTMVALARQRLVPWRDRATVEQTDGSPRMTAPDGAFDRVVSTFVLDLLSVDDIATVVGEAHRVLSAEGLLCVAGLTHPRGAVEQVVMGVAAGLHRLSPALVGGCRAVDVRSFLAPTAWRIVHRAIASKWGIPSEVLVAAPLRAPA